MQLSPEVTKFRSTLKEALYVEAASAPTVNDGRNQRFIIGSRWLNTTTDDEYVCVDNTPTAAIWKSTTSASGGYTPQTAAVAPTVNDDSGDGYAIGKMWVDTVTDTVYIATDVTVGAAVWVNVSSGGASAHIATVAPTVNDDSGDGYVIGTVWVNTTTDIVYAATDVTVGAALWKDLSSGGGGAAVDITATADPLLTGTNVQSQLTSIADILRNAVMYTFMAGMPGMYDIYYAPSVVTGYNLTAL